jgi:trehalose-6-phosphatase
VAAFDFDGTLVKVDRSPEEVHVAARTSVELEALARRGDTTVTVVSGRPLDSLVRLVAAPSAWLFGLHGPTAPILYIGDDTTDEDGFAVLSSADFGVLVDDERARDERPHGSTTRARFTVSGTDAVARVLHTLVGAASCPS